MFEERKELHKEKYKELKEKLSKITCLNGKMLEAKSPNGTTELLEALFERSKSQDNWTRQRPVGELFNDI